MTHLDTHLASQWLQSWDEQQTKYIPRRAERFEVIADLVELIVQKPDPVIVDLGVGPGSLSRVLLRRFKKAKVIGVDKDPFLLAIAQATTLDASRFKVVNADLAGDWTAQVATAGTVDAFVSTTALHWLDAPGFAKLTSQIHTLLRPGGVFLDGDHFYHIERTQAREDAEANNNTPDSINIRLEELQARRDGVAENQSWEAWWEEAATEPKFAELLAAREEVYHGRTPVEPATIGQFHEACAGFSLSNVAWQHGADHILYAIK